MSIKIYNGKLVRVAPNLIQLKKISKNIKEMLAKKRLELYSRMFPTSDARHTAFLNARSNADFRSFMDFGAELVWFGLDKETSLMIPFLGMREYQKSLDGFAGLEDYGYWDNSDAPEDLSAKEWKKRLKDWEKVLLKNTDGIPSQEGFTIRILPEGLPLPWEVKD